VIGRVSHAAVFPKCAAVVHHGGAGTTHTALLSGVPSIIVPHVADQFFWADELARMGVSPAALPRRSLTADALALRVRTTLESGAMRRRAQDLSARIRAENGVEAAVTLIEGLADR